MLWEGKRSRESERERERERDRGLRLPLLDYHRFFSELQSASALSVHSCSPFPS